MNDDELLEIARKHAYKLYVLGPPEYTWDETRVLNAMREVIDRVLEGKVEQRREA